MALSIKIKPVLL